MLKIHNNELAENTIIPYELLILLIINHFSKTKMLTDPLTAISVIVINGIIIINIYVAEIGIIALKYVSGTSKAQIGMCKESILKMILLKFLTVQFYYRMKILRNIL